MNTMNNMKKFASILLALVMVLAMAAPAMAAGTGSITVENPIDGESYTAYKIFDVVYNEDQTAYAYTIAADSEWLSTVQAYEGITLSENTITGTDGKQYYIVEEADNFSAGAFSAVLKAALTDAMTGVELEMVDGKAVVDGLDLGYYFVTSVSGALCNLTTTDPDAIIRDKNDVPFDKVDDDESVEVGQTVNYTITSKVPDTTGFATYTFKITDTMSDGLDFKKDVKVTIGGADVTNACTITYSGNGYELTVPVVNYQNKIGAEILVKYSAIVNADAVSQIENNTAKLEYTNNPDGSTTSTPEDVETVYTAKIVIDKYDRDDKTKKLVGAKFVLKNAAGKFYKYTEAVADDVTTTETDETAPAKVEWVDNQIEASVVVTDEQGYGEFIGLEDGTYTLVEIEAPVGYNKLEDEITITVNGKNAVVADLTSLTVKQEVQNVSGRVLPETGGMGTTMFYALGSLMIVGAALVLLNKKRIAA